MSPLLLDTCALLWLFRGEPMLDGVAHTLRRAGEADQLYVSAVSGWEIGQLWRKRGLVLQSGPGVWFERVLSQSYVRHAPLTGHQAVQSSLLPGDLHDDPADRLLVATARSLEAALVTRDARLIAYAKAGHMQVLPC